jgi:hypothetical protein
VGNGIDKIRVDLVSHIPHVFKLLITDGEEAVWKELEDRYSTWIDTNNNQKDNTNE